MRQVGISVGDSRVVSEYEFSLPEALLFLAFGTALLESLNRMKCQQNHANPVWASIEQKKTSPSSRSARRLQGSTADLQPVNRIRPNAAISDDMT